MSAISTSDIICIEASWQAPLGICMDTEAASALPLKNGSHNSIKTATNFLNQLVMRRSVNTDDSFVNQPPCAYCLNRKDAQVLQKTSQLFILSLLQYLHR